MSASFLTHEVTERLVGTLGHSLWQGVAVALLLIILLRILPARSARTRYVSCLTALGGMVLCCLITWKLLEPKQTQVAGINRSGASLTEVSPAPVSPVYSHTKNKPAEEISSPMDWRTPVLLAWCFGAALGLGRLVLAVAGDRRLRRQSQEPEDAWLVERLSVIAARLKVRQKVRILLNPDLVVPAVCGLFRPVILLPASMLAGVPVAYLEAALAHELAHIRRYDYLVNLVQMAVEALLFFNPGVWWISRQIRREREACCDALAISVIGEPCTYARALTAVAEVALAARGGLASAPVLAMTGESRDKGQLIERVRRVLRPGERPGLRLSLPSTLTFLALSVLVLGALRITTNAAIDIMTPEERVEMVAELQKEYPIHAVEMARPTQSDGEQEPKKKITLSGRIVSADGSALREYPSLRVAVSNSRSDSISSHTAKANGEFKCEASTGNIMLLAEAEDWAPKYLNLGKVTESQHNLVLKLEKGYSSNLQFLSPERTPVAGVTIRVRTVASLTGRTFNGLSKIQSGSDGIIRLDHLTPDELIIEATVPGYQQAQWDKVSLTPNETRPMIMDRATIKSGSIVDAISGAPVEGAEIKRYKEHRPRGGMGFSAQGPVVARSNREGRFTLDTLEEDTEYHFLVTAPGHLSQILSYSLPGELPQVRLAPRRTVRVEVRNIKPEQLNRDGEINLSYDYLITIHGLDRRSTDSSRDYKQFTARSENGTAKFEVPLLIESETGFRVGNRHFEFSWAEMTDGRAVYVLDLQAPEKKDKSEVDPATLRTVEIKLNTPQDSPPATGKLIVGYIKNLNTEGIRQGESTVVDVSNGTARLEISAPNRLTFGVEGLQGYWFRQPGDLEVPLVPKGETVELSVDTFPAGAIYGTLLDAGGNPAQGAMISVYSVPGHKVLKDNSIHVRVKNSSSSDDDSSRFIASPLPLGGKFIIGASQRNSRVFSTPMAIDEKTPFHHIQLQFPAGETIRGKIIGPDGEPIKNVEISLSLENNFHGIDSFGNTGAITDRNGEFQIERVNTNLPGKYYVQMEKVRGAQPARMEAVFGKPMEIRLKQGNTLSGVVKEAGTGRAVPGAEVYAVAADLSKGSWPVWLNANALSDKQGRFHFDQLPPGSYNIRSRSGNQEKEGPPATAGQTQDVILELKLLPGSGL